MTDSHAVTGTGSDQVAVEHPGPARAGNHTEVGSPGEAEPRTQADAPDAVADVLRAPDESPQRDQCAVADPAGGARVDDGSDSIDDGAEPAAVPTSRPLADTGEPSIDSALEDYSAVEGRPLVDHLDAAGRLDQALRETLAGSRPA